MEECCSSVKGTRHRRKKCGHCNELLSYSAYRSHKTLFYNEAKGEWNLPTETVSTQSGSAIEEMNYSRDDGDMDTSLLMDLESSQLHSSEQDTISQLEPGT